MPSTGTTSTVKPVAPGRDGAMSPRTGAWLALRLLCWLLTAGTLAWAFLGGAFRGAEGQLTGRFVVPVALAVVFLITALFATRERLRFLAWAGTALVGQAITLQLIHAGPSVGYQHIAAWSQLAGGGNRVWSALLVLQLVVVTAALAGRRHALARWLAERWTGLRLAAVVILFVLTSATLSRPPQAYVQELVLATLLQLLALATVVLAFGALPASDVTALQRRSDHLLGAANDATRLDRFSWFAAGFAVLAAALLNVLAYQRQPHVPDEFVYLLHARYFAHGLLSMKLPPVPAAFDIDLMTYDATRWYSPVPPGWPAVLALGARLGAAWLVNPLLSGISVLLAYRVVAGMYGRRLARLSVLLLCSSPWFLFMGMSFMNHQVTLPAALLAALAVLRLRDGGRLWWALPAGIGLGFLGLSRPLEGFTAALLLGLWTLGGRPRAGRRVLQLTLMGLTAMATAATTLPYNRHFTGRATYFPIMAYTDSHYGVGSNSLGFGANRGLPFGGLDPFPGHGPIDVAVNANFNAFQVNIELLGWATGSLLLLALLVFSRRMQRRDWHMLAVILAITGAHSFYWFSGGPDFGARYWYLILIPCLVLSARGLEVLSDSFVRAEDGARPQLAVLALCLATLLVFVPWRAADKYYHYRGGRPDVRTLALRNGFGRSLVLVRGRNHPDYAAAAVYNPVDLQSAAPVYAWDRDAATERAVLEAFPDRPVWILMVPRVRARGFAWRAGR